MPPICTVGVTGHRHLPAADPASLEARIEEALRSLRDERAPSFLATALAEGADRIVAKVALRLGFELYCPLPFEPIEYERDFPESVDEFRGLLSVATEVSTVPRQPAASRVEGYTAAGRAMLDVSRVLLALWDGKPARGEGGTAQMIDEALTRGLPVWWITVDQPHLLRVRLPGQSHWGAPVEAMG